MTASENALALVGWTLLMAVCAVSCLVQVRRTEDPVWKAGWFGLFTASLIWFADGVQSFSSARELGGYSRIGTVVAVLSGAVLVLALVLKRGR
ncbi:MAG: hypothetical protein ACP5R4_00470 [Armatimonadota bacterium]